MDDFVPDMDGLEPTLLEPNADCRSFAVNLMQMFAALMTEGFDEDFAKVLLRDVMQASLARGLMMEEWGDD